MQAVVWTDVVQGIVLWLGIFIVLAYLWMLTPGGARAAISLAAANHKFGLGSSSLSLSRPTLLVLCLYGFFFYLQKYTGDQTLVQRYLIARTDGEALRGVSLGALLCVPVWALFMLIGTLLWAFYKLSGEAIPASIHKADQIFPYFLSTHISPVFTGLFMAALFGAAMSSMASDLNCIAVVGVEDFYRRYRPQATDARALRVAKMMVAAFGIFTMIFAAELAGSKGTALSLYFTITSIVAGGLAGLFLLAFLCPRANRKGAYVGIVLSLLVTTWATLTLDHGSIVDMGRWNYPLNSYMIGVVGHVVLFATGYAASLMFQDGSTGPRELTLWGWFRFRREMALAETMRAASPEFKNDLTGIC
jgi:SSS family solute:Na+ symporter